MTRPALIDAGEAIWTAAAARRPWLRDLELVGVGWATVELERAARELEADLDGAWVDGETDELLGAFARLRSAMLDRVTLVLLEPSTEGRLAASLARFGEGVAAAYVAGPAAEPAALGAFALSPPAQTPLGRASLVLDGPAWGPHVVVLEAAP